MAFRTALVGALLGLGVYTFALWAAQRAEQRATARQPATPSSDATAAIPEPGDGVLTDLRTLIRDAQYAAATIEESRRMAARGLGQDATARLRRQLDSTPTHLLTLSALGELQLAQGDGAGAVRSLGRALAIQPDLRGLRLKLGQALFLLEEYEASLNAAAWALEQEPNQIEAHRLAARAALQEDAPDVALRHLRRILDLQGDDIEAWQTLPVVYLRRGEYGRAIQTVNELIRRNQAVPTDYFNLAVAFAQQGQVEDTVSTLGAAALRFSPADVHPWLAEPDFSPVRADARFVALDQQLARNLSGAPTALRPGTPRTDQALGLPPEPDFLDRPIELRAR